MVRFEQKAMMLAMRDHLDDVIGHVTVTPDKDWRDRVWVTMVRGKSMVTLVLSAEDLRAMIGNAQAAHGFGG